MKRPLLSICVTVYNLKDYIGECLDSVLNQNFDDYELLVADNGSTDGSVEICEAYAEKHSDKMTFFKFPPPTVYGRSARKVKGEAKGLYIQSLDGDDCLAPDYFENVARIISAKHPELIIGNFVGISSEEGLAPFRDVFFEADKINRVKRGVAIKYILSLPTLRITVWRLIIKRSLLEDYIKYFLRSKRSVGSSRSGSSRSGIDPRKAFAEILFPIDRMLRAKSIVFLGKPTYFYRRRHASLSTSVDFMTAIRWFYAFWSIHIYTKKHHLEITRKCLQGCFILIMKRFLNGLFMPYYDAIRPDDCAYLSNLIDDRKSLIVALKKYHDPDLDKLSDLFLQYGVIEGIKKYGLHKTGQFFERVNNCRGKQNLVFPTGLFGEATAKQLLENNFDVIGFLDNDEKKNGIMVNGLLCSLPERLRMLSYAEKNNIAVVIASIYENVAEELKKQALELGISTENIVVRD